MFLTLARETLPGGEGDALLFATEPIRSQRRGKKSGVLTSDVTGSEKVQLVYFGLSMTSQLWTDYVALQRK